MKFLWKDRVEKHCAFQQNSHINKLDKILVFYTVKPYFENKHNGDYQMMITMIIMIPQEVNRMITFKQKIPVQHG